MNPIRIGNVEYKTSYNLFTKEPYEEIVLWYDNPNYGQEERLKKEGWTFDDKGNAHKDNCHISSNCFKGKQCCYTIADIEWNRAHDEFDVKSIGTRAFELKEGDYANFKEILGKICSSVEDF